MRFFLIGLVLLIAAPLATAQFATPEEVVNETVEALNREDFARAARTIHPEALEDIKNFFVELEKLFPEDGESLGMLPGGDGFMYMTPHEVYEWLVAMLYTALREDGITMQLRLEYLGHVEESEDVIHAVVRTHAMIGQIGASTMEVITMKRYEAGWLAMLSGDIEQFIQSIRGYLEGYMSGAE